MEFGRRPESLSDRAKSAARRILRMQTPQEKIDDRYDKRQRDLDKRLAERQRDLDKRMAERQRDLDKRMADREKQQQQREARWEKERREREARWDKERREREARWDRQQKEREKKYGKIFTSSQSSHEDDYRDFVYDGYDAETLFDRRTFEDFLNDVLGQATDESVEVEELSPAEKTRRRLMSTLPRETTLTLDRCDEGNVRSFIATVYRSREVDPTRSDWDIYVAYRRSIEVEEPDPTMVEKTQIAGLLLEGNRKEANFPF